MTDPLRKKAICYIANKCEHIVLWCSRPDVRDIRIVISYVAATIAALTTVFSTLASFVSYQSDAKERSQAKHAMAWASIAQHNGGQTGQQWAMELLARDKVPMRSIRLHEIDLVGIDLRGANLEFSKITNSNLKQSNLKGAKLMHAVLACTDLTRAILQGADLDGTIFEGANISKADFNNALNIDIASISSACVNNNSGDTPILPAYLSDIKFKTCNEPDHVDGIQHCITEKHQ